MSNEIEIYGFLLGIALGASLCSLVISMYTFFRFLTWLDRVVPVFFAYELGKEHADRDYDDEDEDFDDEDFENDEDKESP